MLYRLGKEIPHPSRPDSDKHLDEVRTGEAEEGNPRLAGDCAGKQGLSCTRRPDNQNTLMREQMISMQRQFNELLRLLGQELKK